MQKLLKKEKQFWFSWSTLIIFPVLSIASGVLISAWLQGTGDRETEATAHYLLCTKQQPVKVRDQLMSRGELNSRCI